MHCEPESSAPQALFSTVNTGQILSSRVEHVDCELAYILSRFTFKGLILVTQDRLRRRLLHCPAQSEDNEDSIAERDLYQRHVWKNVERSRKARRQHDGIIRFSQIGLFLEVSHYHGEKTAQSSSTSVSPWLLAPSVVSSQ